MSFLEQTQNNLFLLYGFQSASSSFNSGTTDFLLRGDKKETVTFEGLSLDLTQALLLCTTSLISDFQQS
jgi:hypothetical protein